VTSSCCSPAPKTVRGANRATRPVSCDLANPGQHRRERYENLIAAAHAAGLKIFGGTLTPFQGAYYYSAIGEAKREAVNRWIRTSGTFDGVIDFGKVARDPADSLRLLPAYDSGDHLHPDDAGYRAMADAINLAFFRP
jgi:lysophospholipase L1-like esterase